MKNNRVTVYAVGGCGINIVMPLMQVAAKDVKGYADLTFGMIDTSHSNLPDAGFESSFIHIGSRHNLVDGSGKIRATNVEHARQAVTDIVSRWEPGDLSIVVHSGSGGSGSLIGNILTKDLMARGKNVVVVMVGSRTSIKEADNVRDTIMTYQKLAEAFDRPVPCYYLDNSQYPTLADVDTLARIMVLFLSAVWSGENKGLDRMDLENFLNYNKVSDYAPGIVALELTSGVKAVLANDHCPVSTVVTIVKADEDHSPGIMVPYHSYGELNEKVAGRLQLATPVHLVTRQGIFPDTLQSLEDEVSKHRKPATVKAVVVDRSPTDDFLVI